MSNTLKLGNGQWATGKDTVLSFSDTNNNYKPLPFSFSRASSGTVVNKDGLIETVGSGEPRIDFKDNTKGALKLEPQRSNLVPYSQDFTGWTLVNAIETPNALISPDGKLNASKLVSSSNGVDIKYTNIPVTQNTTYTFSFYCNYVEGLGLLGRFYDNTNGANIEYYNYDEQLEENEWKRVTRTFTTPVGCTNIQVWYLAASTSTSVTAYYWGAQLEQGSYATSYIPTSGQANGVTRVAESSSQTPPDGVIGQTEGTMFLDFNIDDISSQTQDPVLIYLKNSSGIKSYLEMYDNGDFVAVHINSGSITLTKNGLNDGRHKAAFAYKDNDFAFYVDGVLAGSNTNFTVASSQTEIGLQYTSVNYTGKQSVNDVKLYNTRLSNSELAALTTI
jgi:hypothetical protein